MPLSATAMALALAGAPATPALAQAPAAPLTASLSISVQADGRATMYLYGTGGLTSVDYRALGCAGPLPRTPFVPCHRELRRYGRRVEDSIELRPLLDSLAAQGVRQLFVSVAIPNRGAASIDPNPNPVPFLGLLAHFSPTVVAASAFSTAPGGPATIRIAFGSRLPAWLHLLAALAPLALVPPVAGFVSRRADPFGWTSRLVPTGVHLACLAWMIYAATLHVDEVLAILVGRSPSYLTIEALAAPLVPAFVTVLLASALATRGLGRRLGIEVPVRAQALLALTVFPVLVAVLVALLLSPGGPDWSAAARTGAALLLGIFLVSIVQSGGIDVRAYQVKEGPLREQVDDLAEGCRSQAGKVFAVPEEMAAAARALSGRRGLVISDDLAQALTKRELDAALALELCRVAKRAGWRDVGFFAASVPLLTCFPPFFILTGNVAADFAGRLWMVAGAFLLLQRWGRRFADAEAARAVGSAEAVGIALFKLARRGRLGPHHLRAEEILFPMHAALRRTAALARTEAADPAAWLEASGREPAPADIASWARAPREEHLFGKEFRARTMAKLSWRLLATCLLVPLVLSHGLVLCAPEGAMLATATLASLAASVVLPILLQPRRLPGMAARRDQLARQLRAEGLPIDGATFVGLAPGPDVHVHDGFFDWDFGFLVLAGETLAFLGDRHRFAVPRARITRVALGPGPPAYRRLQRVHVELRDGRPFHLRPAIPGPYRRQLTALARRLGAWREDPTEAAAPEEAPAFASLAPPDHGPITGTPPRALLKVAATLNALVVIALLGAALAFLTGLPASLRAPGTAWGVPAAAIVAFVALLMPTLLAPGRVTGLETAN